MMIQNYHQKIILILILILATGCFKTNSTTSKTNTAQAANYNVQLGLAYLQQGDMPRAKQKLLLALQQAPHWPVALDAMGYYLEKTGNFKEAGFYYQQAVKLAPHSGAILNNYGTYLCRTHQYSRSQQYFLAAVKDPNYINAAEAYENAGLCAIQAGNKTLAKLYFQKALQQDPRRSTAREMLGKTSI